MSNNIITIENLSKRYLIMHKSTTDYMTLRDGMAQAARNLARAAVDVIHGRQVVFRDEIEEFWALKNVSFEVSEGEILGIIGGNGAGKSTLLKILSRITEPTEGRVTIRGRVSSLLEVGTGFHPELTGRENVYLNGAILGMRRDEIRRKFDEIVAFAGVEQFLDTPVKRYSSGMYVRLAFAVAAHLEPEILVVDEVLAVGDAEFQKKSLGKIRDVSNAGRTVLFVSHNLAAIKELCSSAALLERGSIVARGMSSEIVERYFSTMLFTTVPIRKRTDRTGTGIIRFTDLKILVRGQQVAGVEWGDDVTFEIEYIAEGPVSSGDMRVSITFASREGLQLLSLDSYNSSLPNLEIEGLGVLRCRVPHFPLIQGTYQVHLYASVAGQDADRILNAAQFEVLSPKYPAVGWATVGHQWNVVPKPVSSNDRITIAAS
jgi:lipopolysaccharide transport system ATP-binding protein